MPGELHTFIWLDERNVCRKIAIENQRFKLVIAVCHPASGPWEAGQGEAFCGWTVATGQAGAAHRNGQRTTGGEREAVASQALWLIRSTKKP